VAKTQRQAIEDHAPWKPPSFEPADAAALQALARGSATMDQQKRALNWIVHNACATYDLAYRPGAGDGERDTSFALGRQFVGQQIVKLLNLKIGLIKAREGGA
jgi:hypothetical protein